MVADQAFASRPASPSNTKLSYCIFWGVFFYISSPCFFHAGSCLYHIRIYQTVVILYHNKVFAFRFLFGRLQLIPPSCDRRLLRGTSSIRHTLFWELLLNQLDAGKASRAFCFLLLLLSRLRFSGYEGLSLNLLFAPRH